MTKPKRIAVLMGPTGSGKSAMALAIAASRPTVIINADAMQMVDTLRVLTARPTEDEERQAEHALYGVLKPEEPTSVARWLQLVRPVIARAFAEGKLPLLVGGTGMYVKSLQDGLAEVPPIPEEVRQKYRAMAEVPPPSGGRLGGGLMEPVTGNKPPPRPSPGGGGSKLHALLHQMDPVMAARLKPGDTQRLIRALEVVDATGESLDHWQNREVVPLFPGVEYRRYYMEMAREEVYARIDRRFLLMLEAGALDEVRALLALGLPADLPILRAHGVPELIAYLAGTMTREDAIAKSQQNTRNYAKRQMTWIRNQMADAVAILPGASADFMEM